MPYFWMVLTLLTIVIAFGMYEKTGESFYGYYLFFCATVGVAFGCLSEIRMRYYKEYIQRKYSVDIDE